MADAGDGGGWLLQRISAYADIPALVSRGRSYPYHELASRVQFHSGWLTEKSIMGGDVVAMLSDYSLESLSLFIALLRNRNILVPITSGVDAEIKEMTEESGADWLVRFEGEDVIAEKVKRQGQYHRIIMRLRKDCRAGLVLFSSGSTGKPKAMVHDADTLMDIYRDKKGRSMVILIFLMFDHIGGINTVFNALSMGATMVLPENRDVDHVCSLIEKHKVVVLPTSPTFLNLMLMSDAHKRFDMGSLRMITYGTEPMPESLLGRLREAFRGVRFLQTFGTSETGIAQTSSKSSSSTLIKIDDPNTEYRIVEGELWIRSSTQILGYLNYGMDSFTEDGWFMTGDLAEEEGDGYIRIKGRIKEIINVGGLKVLPEEVESMLMEVPGIADCMVYGESTAITGQMVVADVVPAAEEDRREMFKRIRAYCRDRMENYKIPVKINIKSRTNFGSRFKKIRRA